MKTLAWMVMGGLLSGAFVGCSASGDGPNGGTGGNGPNGGTGGKTGAGGKGNTAGTPSLGAGTPSLGGDVNSGATAGGEMGCNDLTVETKEVTPTVLLLVDNSSSMFDPMNVWAPLQNVLMKADDGVVASLQDKVRFGFTSYRGSNMINDPACPNLFEVDYGLNNYDAIKTIYDQQGAEWKPGAKWETPTGAAIQKAAAKLAAYNPDPPGPKYIVLVTDGNPNTCGAIDPQCGSDESIKAVQDAKAMGIGTYAVGIGDIITNNSGCEVQWGRCGVMHLQDIANAGQGLPVQAPPESLKYQACTPTNVLAATYAAATETPGTAPYFTAANEAELKTALSGLLNSVVSCTYDMNAKVVGNAALGTVKINGVDVPYNDPNGWKLEDNKVQVTLQGTACDTFKSTPNAELVVSFPCKVAVPK